MKVLKTINKLVLTTFIFFICFNFVKAQQIPLLNLWIPQDNENGIYLRDDSLSVLIGNYSTTTNAQLEVMSSSTPSIYANLGIHASGTSMFDSIIYGNNNWQINASGWLTPTTSIPIYIDGNVTSTANIHVGERLYMNDYKSGLYNPSLWGLALSGGIWKVFEVFDDVTGGVATAALEFDTTNTRMNLDVGGTDVWWVGVVGDMQANSVTTTDNMLVGGNTEVVGKIIMATTTDSTHGVFYVDDYPAMHFFGNQNTYVGKKSGNFTNTGKFNTALGENTMYNSTAVSNVTAIGYNVLNINEGANNTAVGSNAMYLTTGGQANTAVGQATLHDNTTGSYNVALGRQAGRNPAGVIANANTIGAYNTYLGYASGAGVPSANSLQYSVAIGANAVVSKSNAMVLGGAAGTGYETAVGIATTTPGGTFGEKLTVVGDTYLEGSVTTTDKFTFSDPLNVYSGNSLFIHEYGTGNFFLGKNSGNKTLTGNSNMGVGVDTLSSLTTANSNMAIGYQTLKNNLTGSNNVAVGTQSMYTFTAGGGNTAFGTFSLYSQTIANQNTSIGLSSLYYNNTGSFNTVLGRHAGTNAGGVSIVNANTIGSYNTYLGYQSGASVVSASSLQYSVAIGANAVVGCSNCMALGGKSTDIRSVKVGIGTDAPAQQLEIFQDGTGGTGGAARGLAITHYRNGTAANLIYFKKARGTEAIPSAIQNSDGIGYIYSQVYDSNSWEDTSAYGTAIDENEPVADEYNPTNWAWWSDPDGSVIERIRMTWDGKMAIATTTPDYTFVIATSTDQYAGSFSGFFQVASSTNQNIFTIDTDGDIQASRFATTTPRALCPMTDGTIGYCSDAVAADGTCTCNAY